MNRVFTAISAVLGLGVASIGATCAAPASCTQPPPVLEITNPNDGGTVYLPSSAGVTVPFTFTVSHSELDKVTQVQLAYTPPAGTLTALTPNVNAFALHPTTAGEFICTTDATATGNFSTCSVAAGGGPGTLSKNVLVNIIGT